MSNLEEGLISQQ